MWLGHVSFQFSEHCLHNSLVVLFFSLSSSLFMHSFGFVDLLFFV